MDDHREAVRSLAQAQGRTVELSEACMAALLAMSHYAEHPCDANEYELEIAIREIRRLRHVDRWRGATH
jgi:hypothetical protein